MSDEAHVIINGQELDYAQSMALRVAVTSFLSDMQHNGLGEDATGKAITEGYIRNSIDILNKIGVIT